MAEATKVQSFLHRFIWLQEPREEMVLDFIRAARLGEAPRLVVYGRHGTGKTRLGQCLAALLAGTGLEVYDVPAMDQEDLIDFMTRFVTPFPQLALTRNFADLKRVKDLELAPVIGLPMVWQRALEQDGIDLAADETKIRMAAAGIWKQGVA